MRISYTDLSGTFKSVLLKRGYSAERAGLSSRLFADASLDGVYSHGVNRFAAHVRDIDDGIILPGEVPARIDGKHSFERWDGRLGPGNLNAWFSMERAIELASEYGMGCVALRNTNHWLRAGNYGWLAAEKSCIGMCFTNTMPNMPPWGGKEVRIGNNPMVIAIPRKTGHLVLDMAISQYAYGKLSMYRMEGKKMPFPGGYNRNDELTADPSEILETGRVLPVGMWKGSGLSMMIDLLVAGLSGGDTTRDIGEHNREYGLSQLFIAFRPGYDHALHYIEEKADELVNYIRSSPGTDILYPGERALKTRGENLKNGIPVNEAVWTDILNLI
jgi:3-dehydro-L-gulonate 2-dehydrogenase